MCEICSLEKKKKKNAAERTSLVGRLKKPSKSGGDTRCFVPPPPPNPRSRILQKRSCMWEFCACSQHRKGAAAMKREGRCHRHAYLLIISSAARKAGPLLLKALANSLPNVVFNPAAFAVGGMIVLERTRTICSFWCHTPFTPGLLSARCPTPFDSCSQSRYVGMSHATAPGGN